MVTRFVQRNERCALSHMRDPVFAACPQATPTRETPAAASSPKAPDQVKTLENR